MYLLRDLIFGAFRFDRSESTLARLGVSLVLIPLYTGLFLLNNSCMLLDRLFFPSFRKVQVDRPLFIISLPRTSTTFLFHALAAHQHFTALKLWEILFAPSIIQKKALRFFQQLGQPIGNPVKKLILKAEQAIMGWFKRVHYLGLELPEEDELALIWTLDSAYFWFFIPHSKRSRAYLNFNQAFPEQTKQRIIRHYHLLVQRHLYVYGANEGIRFLSKNPFFISKADYLAQKYPNAQFMTITRDPKPLISSILALNNTIIESLHSKVNKREIQADTVSTMCEWQKELVLRIQKASRETWLSLQFKKLIDPAFQEEINATLCDFLHLEPTKLLKHQENNKHKSNLIPVEIDQETIQYIKHNFITLNQGI